MNCLKNETSPYLLQHADNPVHWFAWKEAAFEKAKKEDKPILVSIGYSTCHWCHVMEKESFENEETAKLMNENFVCIKVDREERPDVDKIYMEAVQILTGQGGWPLNCFLTPDQKPFFAGTYFPPEPKDKRPSWRQILVNISTAFKDKRAVVEEQANRLLLSIQKSGENLLDEKLISIENEVLFPIATTNQVFEKLSQNFDTLNGGFGGAPKFPSTMSLSYLLNYHYYTNNIKAIEHCFYSLDKMIKGGIYDQLRGGFSRYSTDAQWHVPHFEKMLYDNALLVSLLANAYKKTQAPRYKRIIQETLSFIENEMTHPRGGFYSALDADTEGVEGKFYVWDKKEILEILGDEEGTWFSEFYQITETGNWVEEKTNVLKTNFIPDQFAAANQTTVEKAMARIQDAKAKLIEVQNKRTRPGVDDKILLNWNAMQCSAYVHAYEAIGDESYYAKALKNIQFIFENMVQDDGVTLFHTWKNNQGQYSAFLDDYALFVKALLDVYSISTKLEYLEKAMVYIEFILKEFGDENGAMFYYTSQAQTDVVVRNKEFFDNALPSGNSTMAHNLFIAGKLLDKKQYLERAQKMVLQIKDSIIKYPTAFGRWANVLLYHTYPTNEIAIVGDDYKDQNKLINQHFIPNKIQMASKDSNTGYPLLKNRASSNETLIYLCKQYSCRQPVKTLEELKQILVS